MPYLDMARGCKRLFGYNLFGDFYEGRWGIVTEIKGLGHEIKFLILVLNKSLSLSWFLNFDVTAG
jgi:hypothetical protein